jgi:hypothetical protein
MNKNRRRFIYLLGSGSAFILSGCSFSNSNNSDLLKLDKTYKELSIKSKELEEIKKHNAYQFSVLGYIKKSFNYSIKVMENTNFETPIEKKYPIDITFTFPYFFGPNLALSKNDYFIRKYAGDDLLFFKFGIGDRINNMYRYRKDLFGDVSSDLFVKKYFNKDSVKDLFVSIFYKVTTFNDIDLFIWLKILEKTGLLNVNELLRYDLINRTNFSFIEFFYSNYLMFEKSLDPKNFEKKILPNIPLKEWKFTVKPYTIHFEKIDYIPYTFTLMIMERMILNIKKVEKNTEKGPDISFLNWIKI